MLKRRATPELYQTLLQELRDNASMPIDRIALAHGVEPASLISWYESGLEVKDGYDVSQFVGEGAPLKVLLTLEKVRARQYIQEGEVEVRPPPGLIKGGAERKVPVAKVTRTSKYKLKAAWEAAQDDAIESLAIKGKSARAARQNAAVLLSLTGQMVAAMRPLVARLQEQLQDATVVNSMSAHSIVSFGGKLARMSKDVMEVAKLADDVERELLGNPAAMDLETPIDADASDQDALRVIEEAAEAARLVRAEGMLGAVVAGYTGADDADQ